MRFLVFLLLNALALGAAVWLVDGITLQAADDTETALQLLAVGAILGLINAFVRPLVRLLSIPFIILTLGLFWVVINALMLMLAAAISEGIGLDLAVAGFWSALLGSLVISVCLVVLEAILPAGRR